MDTEKKYSVPSLKDYYFSDDVGFLLETPLDRLPDYFNPWHNIASRIPQLLQMNSLRQEVYKMPKLDESRLKGYRQWRLANTQLSCIGSAFIWQGGDTDLVQSLPPQLAVPWYNTAKHLGIPPGVTYANLFLSNYRLNDPTKPLAFENIESAFCPGRDRESVDLFNRLALVVEWLGTPGIRAISCCMDAVLRENEGEVKERLEAMTNSLVDMINAFDKMEDLLDPEKFYNEVRPFVNGWGGEASVLPNGLTYEGVPSEPITITGTSAAQSAIVPCFDAALKIQQEPDKAAFLEKMRGYMPPAHAELIAAIRRGPCVRKFVEERRSVHPGLAEVFNRCVDAVADFRTRHIQIVTKYILLPAGRAKKDADQSQEEKGTGVQLVVPFLRGFRDSTKDGRLQQQP